MNTQQLIEKYGDIIAEEVNVKQLQAISDSLDITLTYHPRGDRLSAVFGKDTGKIISAAKQGQVTPLSDGIQVTSGDQQWKLTPDQYEVRYTGLDTEHYTVEEGVIVGLDITITPALEREGIAREISRLLNQMRKDADFQVNDRVQCWYTIHDGDGTTIIGEFSDYLKQEALLSSIESITNESTILNDMDICTELRLPNQYITFYLKK